MFSRVHARVSCRLWLVTGALYWLQAALPPAALAAPEVQDLSLRGLQTGAVTTLTIDGTDLLPEPRLLTSFPVASQAVKKGATASRLEVEVKLADDVAPGIYLVRIANAKGVSNAVAVAVDALPQGPLAPQAGRLPVALHGTVADSATAKTTFAGKKGQRIVVEVEARRLGSVLDPIVELHDARGVQVAWSQGLPMLGGDARLEAVLPADGHYSVELHDALYRAGNPNHFRLKIGELRYADLIFPLAVQRGTQATVRLLGNVPDGTQIEVAPGRTSAGSVLPLPRVPGLTSAAPPVLVSDVPEVLETEQPQGKVQEVTVPAAINGRIGTAKEEDKYRLLVKPGMQLRFDVLANRAGSPLDGTLVLRDEKGAQLAANDDRATTVDPGFDFTVPQGVNVVVVGLTDLHSRGGSNYVYRLAVTLAGQPDFSLSVSEDRYHVPQGGTAIVRVRANRAGYNGPIKLSLLGLPQGVVLSGDEIPAGVNETLLSLSVPREQGLAQLLTTLEGASGDPKQLLRRTALLPETSITQGKPWLRGDLGLAVVDPLPFTVAWDTTEPKLPVGQTYAAKVQVTRGAGVQGPIRLTLLTNQVVPNLPPQPGQPPKPDVNKALRFQAAPTIAADQAAGTGNVIVPADLPLLPYDLVIQAELLSPDGKKVLATAVTPSRRLQAAKPEAVVKSLALFEDQVAFVKNLTEGNGKATLEEGDKYSGKVSIKVTPDQRFNPRLPGLSVKIREKPGPGEYRYLRFAWKKKGGQTICLQLAHDGVWGPGDGKPAPFRYHAGPGPECFGAALVLDKKLPEEWVVVTRDLFADFGEFTLTGLALTPLDGEYALFDHIYLAPTVKDFEMIKP